MKHEPRLALVCLGTALTATLALHLPAASSDDTIIRVVTAPPTASANPHYTGNRAPLLPAPFLKLPIGAIKPQGWLRHQLQLEAKGMTGRLQDISKWCRFEGNAWTDPRGEGHSAWEELPYWLKGYGDLGYVLEDDSISRDARKWIDAVLASQDADGWFGPRSLKTSLQGKPDLWPHMVMCNALQSFYEATGDERVIPFLTRYFKWLNTQPGEHFGAGYWPKLRFGDNVESVHWVYNRTGDAWLLDLAKKIHDNMARWDTGVIDWHNVNIAQGFRAPAVFYVQGRDPALLQAAERNYQEVMGVYGQFPGGGFAGDENCRPGYVDPRQGFETCGFVEFTHSFQMLTRISGKSIWADRCEDIAFNSLPAALTPDLKGLHYLTCANQVQLDKGNKAPGIQNGGTMFSYSPYERYRCCQHNVSHGWPYYAEELWLATPDRGLCASLYAASEVTAKVGAGDTIRITETTDYPFSDTIKFKLSLPKAISFPLYLRIPGWCPDPALKVNGKRVRQAAAPGSYLVLQRTWADADTVELQLPMKVAVRTWAKNKDSASVNYGPLTFSLEIGERWERSGGTDAWPELEVFPTTPWNYGLVLDARKPEKSFKIVKRSGALAERPFTPKTVPLALQARARKIPAWTLDANGLINPLQPSPVRSTEPLETVTLIPMGAARLRITAFPVIGMGKDARDWTKPKKLPVSASHCNESDTVQAMVDGKEPKSSDDSTIPRFTWWDHRGTGEWVQQEFDKPRKVSAVEVYWFDDTGRGACRVPASWKLLYRDGNKWQEVPGASTYGVKPNAYNRVQFPEILASALQIQVKLQPEFSGGILEWKIE